jgi:hypothetical protein
MVVSRHDPNNPHLRKVAYGSANSSNIATSDKILLALQFWGGDRSQALALAELIADIEPGMCERADFLFVCRFDCEHDERVIRHVSRKFSTFFHTSPRRGTGWPMGCNDLTAGMLEFVFHRMVAKKLPHYKAIFALEADVVPLNRDWIKLMSHNWDVLQETSAICVAGRKLKSEHIREHVNGNALLTGNFKFLKWLLREMNSNSRVGWDYRLAGEFEKWGWAEIPGLECHWNTRTLSDDQLRNECERGVIFLHGVKDFSALNFARNRLL